MTSATRPASALPRPSSAQRSSFAAYAWGVLGYTLFVIVYGAWVRITGSGAGCGDHWPMCRGEVIPRAPELQTVIEFTHRLTSGLLGPLCLVLVVWAHVAQPRDQRRRRLSLLVVFFVVVEALIGAFLVKRGLVADNASLARAVVVGLHLGNTLLLTACCALLAWLGTGSRPLRLRRRGDLGALVAVALVSMTGAVTALGDTLFPVAPALDGGMFARVRDGLDLGSHALVRLRAVHPILAVCVASWLLWRSSESYLHATPNSDLRRTQAWLHGLVWTELSCGVLNVMLGAPGWMQLVHLGLAQAVWIALVLGSVATDGPRRSGALEPGASAGSA